MNWNQKMLPLAIAALISLSGCTSAGNTVRSEKPETTGKETEKTAKTQESAKKEEPKEIKEEKKPEISLVDSYVTPYVNSIGTQYVQVISEFENTGNTDLYLSNGTYDLEDTEGNLIAVQEYAFTFPQILKPGEKGYIYEKEILDEPLTVDVQVVPKAKAKVRTIEDIRFEVSDIDVSFDDWGRVHVMGRIENPTDEDQSLVQVVTLLKDSDSKPIGVIWTYANDVAANDKTSFEMSESLPEGITADDVASYETFAYPQMLQF